MSGFPQIFTFYSFKGSVGRSMAVLNVAYGLVAKGRNVLVLDMDLEAPGLSGFLRRQEEIGALACCDVVDLVRWAADFSNAAQGSSPPLDAASFPPLTDFIVSVPRDKLESMPHPYAELGRLDIVPVDEERDYYERLTGLAMGGFQQDALVRVGSILRAWLKSRRFTVEVPDYYGPDAERTAAYDYVLVDSRTGVTETGGLCIGPLSDQLVVLTALNDQNVQGTRRFLEEVGILAKPSLAGADTDEQSATPARGPDAKPTMIVASPVPAGEIATKRERLDQLQASVGKAVVKLSYHPQMALMESIFTRDHRDEYLAREYDALLRQVLDMASDSTSPDLSNADLEKARSPSDLRDVLSQSLRFASATGTAWPLRFLVRYLHVPELREDQDFIKWDRACHVLSSGEQGVHLDAWNNRANVLSQWSLCSTHPELAQMRLRAAVECYERVLQAFDASLRQKAIALYNRGVTYGKLGDSERAIADYTAVLQMLDAPPEQKAKALYNRGVTYGNRGESEREMADYTAVIQMSDAPVEQKAKALVNRGAAYGRLGDSKREIADYTAVIQMPDAPAEQKARALVNRGYQYFVEGGIRNAIEDEQQALSLDRGKCAAHANLAVALLADGQTEAALAAYDAALTLADAERIAELTSDLEMALQKYGPLAGADEVLIRIKARRESLEH